jgi:hypothetical protein
MRFAYIDSQGKEVAIPTVDALRLRISLKAIVEDTMFFDASKDSWAPAREHEIFVRLCRELDEEAEPRFVAPPPGDLVIEGLDPDAELEVEGDPPPPRETPEEPEDWRFAISNAPVDRGSPGREAPSPPVDAHEADGDAYEPEGLEDIAPVDSPAAGPSGEAGSQGAAEAVNEADGSGGDVVGDETDALDGAEGPIGSSSWVELDMEGEEDPAFDLEGVDLAGPREEPSDGRLELVPELGGPEPEAAEPSAPLEGLQQDRHDFEGLVEEAGWGDEPPPPDLELETTSVDPDAEAPSAPPGTGANEPPLPTREELLRRADPARPGSAASGPPGAPRKGPSGRRPPRRRRRGAAAALVVVAIAAGGAAWFVLGRGGSDADAERDALAASSVSLPAVPPELQPRVEEVGAAVRVQTFEILRALPAREGVPAEPPSRWLAGDYLANASRFDDVQAFWTGMERFLRVMQASEDSAFAAALDAHVAASGLPADTADLLEARVLAGFRATARERGAIYQQGRGVAEAALRLHAFLRENESRIAYEPGVSSDPVLEAVPATSELGEEMWDRVGDITEAMDSLDFLDRVTTARFVDAVIRRLEEIPLR